MLQRHCSTSWASSLRVTSKTIISFMFNNPGGKKGGVNMDNEKTRITVYLPKELHKQLKFLGVETNKSVSELITEAVIKYLEEDR